MKRDRKLIFSKARRVIVKVGSNVLTEDHGLNLKAIRSITRQICKMHDDGREVILVSSRGLYVGDSGGSKPLKFRHPDGNEGRTQRLRTAIGLFRLISSLSGGCSCAVLG